MKASQNKKWPNFVPYPKWKWPPPPTPSTELGILFEADWPLKKSLKQVEYEKFGTKSTYIRDIMVDLAMLTTTIDKICLWELGSSF